MSPMQVIVFSNKIIGMIMGRVTLHMPDNIVKNSYLASGLAPVPHL